MKELKAKIIIDSSSASNDCEIFIGTINNIPFKVGRDLSENLNEKNEKSFKGDLKGNLLDSQVNDIFKEIDNMRNLISEML